METEKQDLCVCSYCEVAYGVLGTASVGLRNSFDVALTGQIFIWIVGSGRGERCTSAPTSVNEDIWMEDVGRAAPREHHPEPENGIGEAEQDGASGLVDGDADSRDAEALSLSELGYPSCISRSCVSACF